MPRYRIATIFEADDDRHAMQMAAARRFEFSYLLVENLSRRRAVRLAAFLGLSLAFGILLAWRIL